jgi:hypothetical protein
MIQRDSLLARLYANERLDAATTGVVRDRGLEAATTLRATMGRTER